MSDTDNSADVLDVRVLIDRFEELETELKKRHADGQFMSDFEDWIENSRDYSNPIHAAFGEEGIFVQNDIEEFYALREFLLKLRGSGGDHQWRGHWYPVTLVRNSYWEEYARDYAEDVCGDAIREARWPCSRIDWKAAASDLQQDYASASFNGVDYWFR